MAIATERRAEVSVEIGGREITFETGKLAKQADGAVVVRSGDTMVLATAQGRMEAREGADFFPLTVDVEERMYAAGKIPGGFFKREGRPTERAILTARMIDRPIRPLWPKGFKNEVQVICTVLSADMVTAHDILCINGASAALMISPLPFLGPVGAVRVGRIDGQLVVNPTLQETDEETSLDLIVVGTKDGLTMVEAGADEVPEDVLLEALDLAQRGDPQALRGAGGAAREGRQAEVARSRADAGARASHGEEIRERIQAHGLREAGAVVEELLDELAPPLSMDSTEEDITKQLQVALEPRDRCSRRRGSPRSKAPVREQFENDLRALTEAEQDSKELKSAKRQLLFERIIETVELPFPVGPATVDGEAPVVKDTLTKQFVKRAAEAIYKDLVRKKIAVEKRRPDGRGTEEIRPIECEVGVSPRTHGSALFTRGQTQIMSLLTLGTAKEGQRIDDLSLESERRFMHHYNFPPYSVGETGFMRGPKRRDIGHGALAQRALEAVIPPAERLPVHDPHRLGDARVERLVVDGLGLRLDARADGRRRADQGAGVGDRDGPRQGGRRLRHPHGHPGRGGSPRRHGLQGRRHARTASPRCRWTSRSRASRARSWRTRSSRRSGRASSSSTRCSRRSRRSRTELAEHAPRITSIKIDPEQIGIVIGKGGETIRGLEADYEVQIDIEEDGTILIYATEGTKAEAAIAAIEGLTKSPEVGDEYKSAKVVKTTQFGAFVELKKGTDGLLHVSNVGPGRVGHIEDVISPRRRARRQVVQEVDKERGPHRPQAARQARERHRSSRPEELIERAKNAPPREEREERPRGDRDRRGGRGGGGRGRDRDRS